MSKFNYDTYCGLYCGACSIMRAYTTGEKDKLASYWIEPTVRAYLESQGIAYPENEPLELKCHGCKTDTVFINCRPCKIRKCAGERNIEHCIDCSEYPCKFFAEGLHNKDIIAILPHLKSAPKNLIEIKNIGFNTWLTEQEKLWKCPDCQTRFSWYTASCTNCGRDLEQIKDHNKE